MPLMGEETQERLLAMFVDALGAVGAYMTDDAVTDIMANADGSVWVQRHTGGQVDSGLHIKPAQAEQIIRLVANSVGAVCHAQEPDLSAELPGSGARFQAWVPPVTAAPAFVIRKHAIAIFTLDDYVARGICTPEQAGWMREAIHKAWNMAIVGGMRTGKTTLLNALLYEMVEMALRVLTIEDTRELQCSVPNHIALYSKKGLRTMQDHVRSALRSNADRIILGEVRGAEFLDVLDSWNTGHPGGICTVHANGCREALTRMEGFVRRGNVPREVARDLLVEAAPLLVHLQATPTGRVVRSMARVVGLEHGDYVLEEERGKA